MEKYLLEQNVDTEMIKISPVKKFFPDFQMPIKNKYCQMGLLISDSICIELPIINHRNVQSQYYAQITCFAPMIKRVHFLSLLRNIINISEQIAKGNMHIPTGSVSIIK